MTSKIKRLFSIMVWPFKFIGLNLWMWSYFLLSLLPHQKVLKGSRFIAVEDIKTTGLTHWLAPMTDGFKCIIPKGTILIATFDSERISLGFTLIPERYKELETEFVPKEQRTSAKYNGYSFALKYSEIGKRIKPIQS
jgi:hypothetical protein